MKLNCRNSIKKNYFFSMSVIIHNLLSDKKSRSITIFNEIVNIYVFFFALINAFLYSLEKIYVYKNKYTYI